MTEKEREWGVKASRFIKAELKRAKSDTRNWRKGSTSTDCVKPKRRHRQARARRLRRFILPGLPHRIGTQRNQA